MVKTYFCKTVANIRTLIRVCTSIFFLFSSFIECAQASPTGGHVISGQGDINQLGNITSINQRSQKLSLNWNKFDIESKETVNFVQPNSQALAVNRVVGSGQASRIQGHL